MGKSPVRPRDKPSVMIGRKAKGDRKMTWLLAGVLVGIGILAGISAGIFGIGGGIILVPVLVFALGYPQHMANGTSLVALLAQSEFFGVLEYYRAGKIGPENIKAGLIIALGMLLGTLFGSRIAISLTARFCVKHLPCFSFSQPSNFGSRNRIGSRIARHH